jgi:hypothetical protein
MVDRTYTKDELMELAIDVFNAVKSEPGYVQAIAVAAALLSIVRACNERLAVLGAAVPAEFIALECSLTAMVDQGIPTIVTPPLAAWRGGAGAPARLH